MDFHKLISKIAKILDDLGIPYAITGGYAVSIWGRVRATFDIDVVIDLEKTDVRGLATALRKISRISFIDEEMAMQAIERIDEFQFIHGESGIKIDFWVLGKDTFSKTKLKRRRAKSIEGITLYFLSPEDLILSKLLFAKESHSQQQVDDVASIIRIQKQKLDVAYLKKWAQTHATKRLLEALLKENLQ